MYTDFTTNCTNLLHIPGGIILYLFITLAKVTVPHILTNHHFLVGSEQESGSMITVVTPATELLSFKVPSTSCKET